MRPGGIDLSGIKYVPEDIAPAIRAYRIFRNDIFISVAGTLGILGRVPESLDGANLTENADRITSTTCDIDYLMYALMSEPIQAEIDSIQTMSAQPKLALGRIKQFEIAIPESRKEQSRIAAALRDVDYLVASLEQLIKKKQAIKRGMMQELLTGRTRLPGLAVGWSDVYLGDVLAVRHGKNQKAVEDPAGNIPILATGGQIGWARSSLYNEPSVLIGRKGTIDRPQYQTSPFWTVDTLFYTEISPSVDPRYLYYVFLTVDWRSMNEASGVPSLSARRVENVEIRLPDIEEQRRIRRVLDDASAGVELLCERLAKVKAFKQGMMQDLLTGRTRFPLEGAAQHE